MVVIYRHRRSDTNEIFYIGIGKKESRPYDKIRRNRFWKRVTAKTDYTVEIITYTDTWDEACKTEQYLISYYGRRDLGLGNLVNLTDGGDGTVGCTWNIGRKFPESFSKRMSEIHKGKRVSDETRLKQSNNRKGKATYQKYDYSSVEQYLKEGMYQKDIAKIIGCDPSTLSDYIKNNNYI
jgi:hypothetical protein